MSDSYFLKTVNLCGTLVESIAYILFDLVSLQVGITTNSDNAIRVKSIRIYLLSDGNTVGLLTGVGL